MDQQEVNLSPVKSPFFCSGRNVLRLRHWIDLTYIDQNKNLYRALLFPKEWEKSEQPKKEEGKIQGKGVGYAKGRY